MTHRRAGVLVAVLGILAFAAPAVAGASPSSATTVTFDEGYVNTGDSLGRAHAFTDGLTFGTPSTLGFPGTIPAGVDECDPSLLASGFTGGLGYPATGHSGGTTCGSGEFPPSFGMLAHLDYARTTVTLWLRAFPGPTHQGVGGAQATAYDIHGNVLATQTYGGATAANWIPVTLASGAAPIQYVFVNALGTGADVQIADLALPAADSGLTPYWKLTDPGALPIEVVDGAINFNAFTGEPMTRPLHILRENGSSGAITVQASDGGSVALSDLSVDQSPAGVPPDTVNLHLTPAAGAAGQTVTVVMSGTAPSSAGAYDGAPLVFRVAVRPAFTLTAAAPTVGRDCDAPVGLTLVENGTYVGPVTISSSAGSSRQINVSGTGTYSVSDAPTFNGHSVAYTATTGGATVATATAAVPTAGVPTLTDASTMATHVAPGATLRFHALDLPCHFLEIRSGAGEQARTGVIRPTPTQAGVSVGYAIALNDYATSGPAEIYDLTSDSKVLDLPPLTISSFRDTYGMSWKNGDYGLRLDDAMVDELFGSQETNVDVLGVQVRKPEAAMFETIANNHIPGGICFGMAYASLELRDIPSEVPSRDFPRTGNDPWQLTGPTLPPPPTSRENLLLRDVLERFSLQFSDQLIPTEVNTVIGVHGTDDALNAIQSSIAAGEPAIIGMINWNGLSIAGHTVLAYATRQLPDGSTAVLVANSNVPYRSAEEQDFDGHYASEVTNSEIIVKNGNWTFPQLGWSGSEADLVVYEHSDLPIINGHSPSLPSLFTATPTVVFGSARDGVTQLSGARGALFSRGRLAPRSSWPAGVAPLPAFTGARGPLQIVSMRRTAAGPLSATVARAPGGGHMDLALGGVMAALQTSARAGQVDHVGVDPRTDSITYHTSVSRGAFGGQLVSSPAAHATGRASSLSDRVVQFHETSSRGGGETVSDARGAFVLRHAGPPTTLSLTLSAFAADGSPVAVTLPPQKLRPGETLRAVPASWRKLADSPVRIVATVGGRSSSRTVRGRRVGRRYGSVRSVTLTRLPTGHEQLTLRLALSHPPARGWISAGATVLSGRHAVATATPAETPSAGGSARSLSLPLRHNLAADSYRVRVRLLEASATGPVQGSARVTRTLTLRH